MVCSHHAASHSSVADVEGGESAAGAHLAPVVVVSFDAPRPASMRDVVFAGALG